MLGAALRIHAVQTPSYALVQAKGNGDAGAAKEVLRTYWNYIVSAFDYYSCQGAGNSFCMQVWGKSPVIFLAGRTGKRGYLQYFLFCTLSVMQTL